MPKIRPVRILLISSLIIILISIFSTIMTSFDHNEHMYITASYLINQDYDLYYDFSYLQTPFIVYFYAFLFKFLNFNGYYLLTAKVISFICVIISAIFIFLISKKIIINTEISLSIITIYLLNSIIIRSASEVSNYIMPLTLSMASFYVTYLSLRKDSINKKLISIGGIFLGLVIGIKLTYITLIFPFLLLIYFFPIIKKNPHKKITSVLFFVLGLFIGLFPILFLVSDFNIFYFNNLGYHNFNTSWRLITEHPGPMSISSKILFATQVFLQPDNFLIILGSILGISINIIYSKPIGFDFNQIHPSLVFSIFFVFVAIITAIIPSPSFFQYYSMPIGFMVLLFPFSLLSETNVLPNITKKMVFFITILSIIINLPRTIISIPNMFIKDNWSGIVISEMSDDIKKVLEDYNLDTTQKIATLSPLFVIESNLPIYLELSTGPFLYRIGDLLTKEQREKYKGTSYSSVFQLLEEDKPVAILTGFEGNLDYPFIDFATKNNYLKVNIDNFPGDLYVQNELSNN